LQPCDRSPREAVRRPARRTHLARPSSTF
jgi:hypothetical protein